MCLKRQLDTYLLCAAGTNKRKDHLLRSADTNDGTFVAVGSDGAVFHIHGGTEWIRAESHTSVDLIDVVSGDGKFVAIGAPSNSKINVIRS